MYAVIDVGSNTVRLSLFKLENGVLKTVFQKKSMAGLANYVDEYGNLSKDGILRAVSVLFGFQNILSGIEVTETVAFATASLRNIGNTEEALRSINDQTGLNVQVISGEQEAYYGYLGATYNLKVGEGVMVDIGGGSTELVLFKDNSVKKALSMPVGSLNMYAKHVKNLIPSKNEVKEIADAVEAELSKTGISAESFELICGVGGTVRAACKLNNEIYNLPVSNRLIEAGHISRIVKTIRGNDKESLGHILRIVPERIHTIIPGMTILKTVAEYFHCRTINVSKYGIREGYLLQKFISEGVIHE